MWKAYTPFDRGDGYELAQEQTKLERRRVPGKN